MQNEISGRAPLQIAHETVGDEDVMLLWILVWSELVAFGILLTAFLIMSVIHAEDFAVARIHLNPGLAAANTVVLITSGWQAAIAAWRRATPLKARIPLCVAAAFGLLFVVIKCIEYAAEFRYSFDATFSYFFQLYFLITGFHLLHVVFGSFVLFLVAWRPARGNILLIATLWHAIDLVWLVMFPIIYLV
ncbi:cytochrome c oxidase subunit 3 [Aliirhizobium smilacinae]|uniref:Cytochrome c oxidase subunit 3 family protein n=1 Tax=Aliirhizobium smilacinae TaxID=1395944 RepID=A0A5C4XE72_9HYPH|nr:cytochrome c oxidase subunit 3 family protein [Rhizobium smilacinae]